MESNSFLIEVRSWLEILYFLSGIVVMILIGLGLKQLKLARKQIALAKDQLKTSKEIFETQSHRASMEAAVMECKRFAETVIQDAVALEQYIADNGITYLEDVNFENTEGGFKINADKAKKEDVEKLAGAIEIINRFLNGLEAHALFFLSGVADEKLAFHVNARAYLELAEMAFKFIPCTNVDDEDMQPIKALYFIWHNKHQANQLRIKQKEIEGQLADRREYTIKPIGT